MTYTDHARADLRHWLTRAWIFIAVTFVAPKDMKPVCVIFTFGLIAIAFYLRMNPELYKD